MSIGIFGHIKVIGVFNLPGISACLTLSSFVFTIPRIVLVVGRVDEFTPTVKDVKGVVFNEVRCREDRSKSVINAIFPSREGVRYIHANNFTLDVLLNEGIDASIGVNGNEHNVVIGNGLRRVGVSWIGLNGLRPITKLPEVLVCVPIGVIHELDLSGEEINLFRSGIERSHRARHHTNGAVRSARSNTAVLRSHSECNVKATHLSKGVVSSVWGKYHIAITNGPKYVAVLTDGLIDELRLERSTAKVIRDSKERYKGIRLVKGNGIDERAAVGIGHGNDVIL